MKKAKKILQLAAFSFVVLFAALAVKAAKPNIIFILADDLGYGDVGYNWDSCEGKIKTPNINKLAMSGVRLSAHYAAAPVSAPSRASLLTGRIQGECSLKDNCFDRPFTEKDTLGSVLKKAGYTTWAVGKWGIAGGGESGQSVTAHPLDKGFDYYYGFLDHMSGHTYYHYRGNVRGAFMGITENRSDATDTAIGRYSTDLFMAKTKDLISKHTIDASGKPFFLYLAVNAIHGSGFCDDSLKCKKPLHVPGGPYPEEGVAWPLKAEPHALRNTWINPAYAHLPENQARYATAITRLDDSIGDLVRHLEKLGIARDTVIIFTSDNGPADEYGADPRAFTSNGPFDGLKRDVFEGGLRVPTFVNWPNGITSGQIDAAPSQFHDWMATLAEIGGVSQKEKEEYKFGGVSLLPRWTKGSTSALPSRIYSAYNFPWQGSTEAFKEFKARKGEVRGQQQMVREGDFVALRTRMGNGSSKVRIYNVVKDPYQKEDLSAKPQYIEKLKRLTEILDSKRIGF